jgi:Predicted membrane protein
MSSEQFGSWMALAVHDTSSVIGASMSFNDNSVETATTLKLGRTLWLIPLIIILGVVNKNNKSTKSIFPMFVLAFILAIFAGNLLNFDEQVLAILKNISSIFLVGALFCIGTQINLMSIKVINSRIIIFALLLWLFALSAAYFLINII